jgi:branched-chain amino acid transport system substrate-binding protein
MANDRLQALMNGVSTGQLSRRDFMRRAAVLGLSGSAIAAFLAACGASSTATPAPAAGGPASAAPAASSVPAASAAPAASTAPAAGGGATSGNVKIYSSFPRTGANKSQTDSVVNGIKMAFEQAGNKAGNFTIVYGATEDLDDGSPAKAGNWDAAVEAANATKALNDPDCMVYIGTFNSGAAKVSVPILNAADLVMISPANTAVGLTKPEGAGEPDIYYPTKKRTYCRVIPPDDLQGAVGAAYAKELGAKKVYILDDNEAYGKGIANVFNAQAKKLGIEVAAQESIDKAATDYRSLGTKIRSASADMVYFGGITGNNAGKLWKDLRGVLGKDFKMMGPDGIFDSDFLTAAAEAAEGTYLSFGGLPPDKLTGKGAEWYTAYKAKFNVEPESYAAYGYEAATVVVDAIKRAGKKDRTAIREALMSTKDWDGVLGKWSFDANGDTSLTGMSINQVKDGKFTYVKSIVAQ